MMSLERDAFLAGSERVRRGARRLPAPRGAVAPPVTPPCTEPPERAPQPTTASTRKQWGLLGDAFALQDQTSLAVSGAPAHDHEYYRVAVSSRFAMRVAIPRRESGADPKCQPPKGVQSAN
jgi:hypothetical protein